ncbi:MAG: hypothetical protein K0Q59_912 [Paenibacillus sp.]|jgi:hypothetical protein|nr:hypothetical protein [Paenibacillus sp.]
MNYPFVIEPVTYEPFADEQAQLARCKEWGLLSEKAVKLKSFVYKRNGAQLACTIVGYVDKATAVIELDNKQLHCIHPAYLKEMQAANFGVKATAQADSGEQAEATAEPSETAETAERVDAAEAEPADVIAAANPDTESDDAPTIETVAAENEPSGEPAAHAADVDTAAEEPQEADTGGKRKSKKEKLELPEQKVQMVATVQEFTTVPNNFSDNDDEVIIYEQVSIVEPAISVGTAWSSHSATLKKLELEIGDTIAFEGKIVAKKLTKHPVPYKINNPAKIQKSRNE